MLVSLNAVPGIWFEIDYRAFSSVNDVGCIQGLCSLCEQMDKSRHWLGRFLKSLNDFTNQKRHLLSGGVISRSRILPLTSSCSALNSRCPLGAVPILPLTAIASPYPSARFWGWVFWSTITCKCSFDEPSFKSMKRYFFCFRKLCTHPLNNS